MTDYSLELEVNELQLAFLSDVDVARPDVSNQHILEPVAYQFAQTDIFPELSEWSRFKGQGEVNDFDGISFTQNNHKAHVTVTMSEANTGFKNIFGKYTVDPRGTIQSVELLTRNTRDIESGQQYSFIHESTQESLQFFLIANGYSYNKQFANMDQSEGSLSLVYGLNTDDERLAKITDEPSQIELVYKTHEEVLALKGNIYHTAGEHLNHDSKQHSISGLVSDEDENILRIGFEDFPNLGDADFNDLVFDVEIAYIPTSSTFAEALNDISPTSGLEDKTLNEINLEGEFANNNTFSAYDELPLDDFNRIFVKDGAAEALEMLSDDHALEEKLDTLLAFEKIIYYNDSDDVAILDFIKDTTQPIAFEVSNITADSINSGSHAVDSFDYDYSAAVIDII